MSKIWTRKSVCKVWWMFTMRLVIIVWLLWFMPHPNSFEDFSSVIALRVHMERSFFFFYYFKLWNTSFYYQIQTKVQAKPINLFDQWISGDRMLTIGRTSIVADGWSLMGKRVKEQMFSRVWIWCNKCMSLLERMQYSSISCIRNSSYFAIF